MTPLALREEIPALNTGGYLNYGAHGPSPRRVVAAVTEALEGHEYAAAEADPYKTAFASYDRSREQIAALLSADPDCIALTESTTDGIARVATALGLDAGDTVVRTDLEHPAGMLPWRRLERDGITVRVVETENGRIDRDAFADAVADATVVCFSAITWTHGTQLPVADLVGIARDAGTFTLVDAVQVPGQAACDVSEWGADVVAGAGHKWLLGPWGAGFLYVNPASAHKLAPTMIGYRGATTTDDGVAYDSGARRLELGSMSPGPHAGLAAAIDAIRTVGLSTIERRIETLTDRLKAGIDDDRLLSPRAYHSGLVTIDAEDPAATVDRLAKAGLVVRSVPTPDAVRVSVHAVTTEDTIDRVIEAFAAG